MVAAFPAESPAAPAKFPPVKTPATREEADLLLLEMGRLDALEARNDADCKKAVAAVVQQYSARNKVTVDGVEMAIVDRYAQLHTALAAYAEAHKAELIPGKVKTVKMNYGDLKWTAARASLEPVDGQSAAGRASLLDKLHEFLIEKLSTFEGLTAAALACLNPQLTWRKTELMHARQQKRIEADELRKIGFKLVDEGEDNFDAKPKPFDLSSQSSTSP
jgi:phage host-nuclease inhibitor protein Gam